ncbi:hypothetical protein V1290_002936 [Bradyrhizobium sp. AZCC 1578]
MLREFLSPAPVQFAGVVDHISLVVARDFSMSPQPNTASRKY